MDKDKLKNKISLTFSDKRLSLKNIAKYIQENVKKQLGNIPNKNYN